ncbi:MAG: ferritin-like domain-containing protein [Planctomycetota bacterium]|jgi:rubrerythrin
MSNRFNTDEVLEMAKQIEQAGVAFYRAALERAEDPLVRQLLLDLASMEEEHLRRFSALQARWKERGSLERVFDPDDLSLKILQAWAKGKVFDLSPEATPPFTGNETLEDILRTAVQKEKDSVIFYAGLQEAVQDPKDREGIDAIIREELGHIALITGILEERDAPKG